MLHNAYQEGTTYILHAKLCLILHVLVLPSLTLIENLGDFTTELHVLTSLDENCSTHTKL